MILTNCRISAMYLRMQMQALRFRASLDTNLTPMQAGSGASG
jgi:hypothetical protein